MKKMFSMVLSLIMLIGIAGIMPVPAFADTARELSPIKDPGFEGVSNGDELMKNGWQSYPENKAFQNGGVSIETNSDNVYNGCHSLKVTSPSGTNGSVSTYYTLQNLKPNTSYTIGAWTKSSGWEHAAFIVKSYGGAQKETKIGNSKFAYRTVEFTTGENNTSAEVVCQANWDGYTVWFDDFNLVETSTLKTKNLITNPGFETAYVSDETGQWSNITQNTSVFMQRNEGTNIYSHSGEYCLRYGAVNASYQQTVKGLKPNTMYTLSFWIKAEVAGFGAGVKNFDTDTEGKNKDEYRSTDNTAEYEKKTINFKTGSNKTSVVVYVYSWDKTGWADDFELYETTCLNYVTLNGEKESVPRAGANTISVTVANPGSENISPKVIAAYYNSNNVLEQVKIDESFTVIEPSRTATVTLTLESLPDDAAQGRVRVFLFDGFSSLKPLDNSVVFETQN